MSMSKCRELIMMIRNLAPVMNDEEIGEIASVLMKVVERLEREEAELSGGQKKSE